MVLAASMTASTAAALRRSRQRPRTAEDAAKEAFNKIRAETESRRPRTPLRVQAAVDAADATSRSHAVAAARNASPPAGWTPQPPRRDGRGEAAAHAADLDAAALAPSPTSRSTPDSDKKLYATRRGGPAAAIAPLRRSPRSCCARPSRKKKKAGADEARGGRQAARLASTDEALVEVEDKREVPARCRRAPSPPAPPPAP